MRVGGPMLLALKHEVGVQDLVREHRRVADICSREYWLVLLLVLARYRVLDPATLEEHVLVQRQHHGVLGVGAHGVVHGGSMEWKC